MRDTGPPVFPTCHFHCPTTRGNRPTPAQGQGDVHRFQEELCGINHKRIVLAHCVDITRVPKLRKLSLVVEHSPGGNTSLKSLRKSPLARVLRGRTDKRILASLSYRLGRTDGWIFASPSYRLQALFSVLTASHERHQQSNRQS